MINITYITGKEEEVINSIYTRDKRGDCNFCTCFSRGNYKNCMHVFSEFLNTLNINGLQSLWPYS